MSPIQPHCSQVVLKESNYDDIFFLLFYDFLLFFILAYYFYFFESHKYYLSTFSLQNVTRKQCSKAKLPSTVFSHLPHHRTSPHCPSLPVETTVSDVQGIHILDGHHFLLHSSISFLACIQLCCLGNLLLDYAKSSPLYILEASTHSSGISVFICSIIRSSLSC